MRILPHLLLVLLPVTFFQGFLSHGSAGVFRSPRSILLGGLFLCFVSGLAATAERFRAFAAGAPLFRAAHGGPMVIPAVYVRCGFGLLLAALSLPLVVVLGLIVPIRAYARRRVRSGP